MRRKNSLIIPAVLAFSLCTVNAVPVLAEDAAQTEAEADTASDEASDAAEDTADTPYEKGTITETDYQSEWLNEVYPTGNRCHEYRRRIRICYATGPEHAGRIFRHGAW